MTSCGPRTPDSATRDDPVRNEWGEPREGVRVDASVVQVSGVDADQPRSRVDRALDLVRRMTLDERGEPDRLGPFDQADQSVLLQCHHEQQREVSAAGPRLPQLVARQNEVLAQHGGSTAARTARKSSSVPPKRRCSVSTLIAVAPPAS